MYVFGNLTHMLQVRASEERSVTFIGAKGEHVLSYAGLYVQARRMLHVLQKKGLRPKDELVFQIEDNERFIPLFWACILGGIRPVPVTDAGNEEQRLKLSHILSILNRPFIAAAAEEREQLQQIWDKLPIDLGRRSLDECIVACEELEAGQELGVIYDAEADEIAFIQFSSGSTGEPKGVILTHGNLLANMEQIIQGSQAGEKDASLSWMPLTHDMGLIGFHLAPIYANMNQYLMPTSLFVQNPTLWLQKAHEHQITQLSSPNFGFKHFLHYFKETQAHDWNLSHVRLIFNGAEPISETWCLAFVERLAPYGLDRNAMFPVYGLAEASLAVTFPPVNEGIRVAHLDRSALGEGQQIIRIAEDEERRMSLVDLGLPVAGCQIRITAADALLAEGCIGDIEIYGPNVTQGYYNDERATAAAFTPDGWLRTGDMGFICEGRLTVTGRKKELIFVSGRNVYPHDLERLAESLDGIELGKVAAAGAIDPETGESVALVFVLYRRKLEHFASLALEVKKVLNLTAGVEIAHVLPVKRLPKTTSGKLQRYKLAAQFERGEFETIIAELDQQSSDQAFARDDAKQQLDWIGGELVLIFQDVLGNTHQLGSGAHFFELGGNSLKATMLQAKLQERFRVSISMRDLFEHPTIAQLSAWIKEASAAGDCVYHPLVAAPPAETYPVTPSQRRIFIQEQQDEIGTSYHIPLVLSVEGFVDTRRLGEAVNSLVCRHEPLRTCFEQVDGEIRQRIVPSVDCPILFLPSAETVDEAAANFFAHRFDLRQAPLCRFGLFVEDGCSYLLMDIHHIICDGISLSTLIREFQLLYQGVSLAAPALQYKDYAVWLKSRETSEEQHRQADYWRARLSRPLPVLELPADFPRKPFKTYDGAVVENEIDPGQTVQLERLSLELDVTVNTLLVAVYLWTLHLYTGQDELAAGSLVAGRTHHDTASMFGMFNNYVPIVESVKQDESFRRFAQRLHRTLIDAYDNQDFPFDEMAAFGSGQLHPSRNPLFDTMVIYHNELEAEQELILDGVHWEQLGFHNGTAKLDVKLDVYRLADGGLHAVFEYNTGLFLHETIEGVAHQFHHLLGKALAYPDKHFDEMGLVSDIEKARLLEDFNATETDYDQERLIHQWLEDRAKLTPDAPAVRFRDEVLTYGELNARSNALARTLRGSGVVPDSIVGILSHRSTEMMIGIMAILKAGGAYLPIDPTLPIERIRYMLADSGASLLLAQRELVQDNWAERADFGGYIFQLEDENLYPSDDDSDLAPTHHSRNIAYVIYTSGSTGKPKGVVIEHHSVINRISWMQKAYPLGPDDVVLQKTPITFDVSIWELFWWSLAGASVSLLEPGGEKDAARMIGHIRDRSVTTMHFVPSMFNVFLDELERNPQLIHELASLQTVFCSGEALPVQLAKRFRQLTSKRPVKLVNLYGPTEATVDVTYYDCTDNALGLSVPIGQPIDNTRLYILDGKHRLLPAGVTGELYIAGAGLARGYLNKPELTAERFVTDPFFEGERMYASGDLAKWMPDGNIAYLGRIDHQVKVRGYRIECGEIEAELRKLTTVQDCLVMTRTDMNGNAYLCAYVALGEDMDFTELRNHIAAQLPEYMVPTHWARLAAMPLTASGKADRSALPEAAPIARHESQRVQPEGEVETQLVQIWREVLGSDAFGVTDIFFQLGGHSLNAAQVVAMVQKRMGIELTIRNLFANPTIRELARAMTGMHQGTVAAIERVPEQPYYPLASAQQRLFILQQLEGIGTTYHLPFILRIEGSLDKVKVEAAVSVLIERQEALRTSFDWVNGEPVQIVHAPQAFKLETCNAVSEEEAHAWLHAFVRPFDLAAAPLLRGGLASISEELSYLIFDFHHLIADGLSGIVFAEQLLAVYAGEALAPLPLQYKDYAVWQRALLETSSFLSHEQYWLKELDGELPVLQLPADEVRPPVQSYEGASVAIEFDDILVRKLQAFANQNNMTLYMVLLAVYAVLLAKYSDQEDIIVGTPEAGRDHEDIHPLVGMFVNTLPIRLQPASGKRFIDLLGEVKAQALEAFEHSAYPFEQIVEKLHVKRDPSRPPLFSTMFVLQNQTMPTLAIEGLRIQTKQPETTHAKFDLTLEIVEAGGALRGRLEYAAKLFHAETASRMAQHYLQLLRMATAEPELRLSELTMITDEEIQQIALQFNATAQPHPDRQLVHEWLEHQAVLAPDRPAVTASEGVLTYGELNRCANRLASKLRTSGVEGDTVVAIMAERSLAMMVGIYAILKAGGAYLPISPQLPGARITHMLKDSGAHVLLTLSDYATMELGFTGEVMLLDDAAVLTAREESSTNPPRLTKPGNLAYVIYTSGSTGLPKGVMIEHRAIVNRLHWMQSRYPLTPGDVILQKTPITFDVSVWELLWWGMSGASLHLLAPGGEKDPDALLAAIEEAGVTTLHFVPSMLSLFTEYVQRNGAYTRLQTVKQVFASGEALQPSQVEAFYSTFLNGRLANLYGPTEAAVDVTFYDCETEAIGSTVPIGRPIDNMALYILSPEGVLQPIGVPGELCIAGVGVARGYLNRPELTRERFTKHPLAAGGNLYRTGDLAKWRSDGSIEYLGRIDSQVKIRGQRLELGEIEYQLMLHPDIRESVVLAKPDREGALFLCGYFVSDRELAVQELRAHLAAALPEYMVPAYFIRVDFLPVTANGKLDRKALPEPVTALRASQAHIEPASELERQLAEIWQELLEVGRVGTHDQFFEIGGNSLLLIRAHAKIETRYPKLVKVTDLFAYPTIAQLAEYMERARSKDRLRELPLLEIPSFITASAMEQQLERTYQFMLDTELSEGIRRLAKVEGVQTDRVLLALYVYVLASLSKQTVISVQATGMEFGRALSLTLDVRQAADFASLVMLVQAADHANADKTYQLSDISTVHITKATNQILPLFQSVPITAADQSGLRQFDLRLAYEEERQTKQFALTLSFNNKRLNKDGMKSLIDNYIKLCRIVTQSYLARSETGSSAERGE